MIHIPLTFTIPLGIAIGVILVLQRELNRYTEKQRILRELRIKDEYEAKKATK